MRMLDKLPRYKSGELMGKECLFEGCKTLAKCRGLCEKHYSRAKNNIVAPSRFVSSGDEVQRFHDKYIASSDTDCWLWIGGKRPNGKGVFYGRHWTNDGKGIGAHRFSYLLFNGAIPSGAYVCHKCDTPLCVNPDHLFIGSHKDNMLDMRQKNRQHNKTKLPIDKTWHTAKLTAQQVSEIRSTCKSLKEICSEYGLSRMAATRLLKGETY